MYLKLRTQEVMQPGGGLDTVWLVKRYPHMFLAHGDVYSRVIGFLNEKTKYRAGKTLLQAWRWYAHMVFADIREVGSRRISAERRRTHTVVGTDKSVLEVSEVGDRLYRSSGVMLVGYSTAEALAQVEPVAYIPTPSAFGTHAGLLPFDRERFHAVVFNEQYGSKTYLAVAAAKAYAVELGSHSFLFVPDDYADMFFDAQPAVVTVVYAYNHGNYLAVRLSEKTSYIHRSGVPAWPKATDYASLLQDLTKLVVSGLPRHKQPDKFYAHLAAWRLNRLARG